MPAKKASDPEPEPEPVDVEPSPPPPQIPDSDGYRVTLFGDGSGTILYPSERVAASITITRDVRQCLFMHDDRHSTILASFDVDGVGNANFKDGAPRLVVTKRGWTQSDEKGDYVAKGEWPRENGSEIRFQLNKCFTFIFKDRQNMTVIYSADGATHEFACGEVRKRADKDTYLDKAMGTIGGKVIMNVDRGHELHHFTTTTENHKYVALGPHHKATRRTGVNSLPTMLQTVEIDEFKTMVDEQNLLQQRLKLLNTLPVPLYGTSRDGGAFSLSMGSTASAKSILSASHKMFFTQPIKANTVDELPPIQFTKAQKKTLRSLYKLNPNSKSNYRSRREKIKQLKVRDFDDAVARNPSQTLFIACCMADWQPLCRKVMPVLEEINQEVRKVPATPTSIGPDGELVKPQDDEGPLAGKKVQIVTMDMSESRMLQTRYNFRCVPMFLCYFGAQLVHASNTMRTKNEFIAQAVSAIDAGMKGYFLPKDFKFQGVTTNDAGGHAILDRCM
uniref:FAM194 C-terminal domain-containing protein n=1 Tax=Pyramimonas obovata TaxID=1411642 RepID=A0A7S0R159_9CHLO|mmetsp:Transcript_2302/g.4654  ORF Transcript_2302/g.4654 Transcript_2302/m.4654 type:complete len:504 (+) Transcript_2302:275-1786(+)|eukprot:CAMPEP_0118941928 /NCGR_PEP_ID=MMETSP1169-20130426/34976_1 /TAXON_ID=36882 /ORGANISM="Pyramimonas obovata, Strain CCMP722" /LENGTH=503 /DNA_ID=CAMNT_0006886817 /DNA_START=218 /DNA_END=1729 /DNA_ORIENTATION=+